MAGRAHRRGARRLGLLDGRRGQAARDRGDQVAGDLDLGAASIIRAALATYRRYPARVAISAIIVFGGSETVSVAVQAQKLDAGTILRLALALVAVTASALGVVFYPGLLDRIVGVERGHREAQSLSREIATLPYGRLIGAELLFELVVTVGTLLLIVPGVIAFTLFGIVGPMITMEDHGVVGAFKRSARLVRPHFWRVFFMISVPLLLEQQIVHYATGETHGMALWLRFVVHGLVGALVGSMVGLVEVHLAVRLAERTPLG
ncbi:MAG TPA: hypothetical protein VIC35_07540 [Acidimicrobiia bacterium]